MTLTAAGAMEHSSTDDWAAAWLEAQGQAVAVVDRDLRVLWTMPGVHDLLAGEAPIVLRDGCLSGSSRPRQTQLVALLDRAAEGSPAVGLFDQGDPDRRLIIYMRRFDADASALGVAIRRDRREVELPDVTAAFGLTAAEQQIMARVVNGQSATDIADSLGIAVLTVRTHIKRAYSKIGVHSKEQLFARLMGFLG